MIKITILDQKSLKKVTEYDARLVPMVQDEIDLPKFGIVKVTERIFMVDKPNEVIIKVSR